jgi:RNA polymerase sigma factor (sigma-70 family)
VKESNLRATPSARASGVAVPEERPGSAEEGNSLELERLFRAHEPRLGRFLAQVVDDRQLAEDLVQETFLAAYRDRDRIPTLANPEAWLFGIARNRVLHALRTRQRAWRAIQRLSCEPRPAQPDPAEAAAVRDFLARHLDPDERILLVLRYVHGFRSHELAEIAGRSPEAIRKSLSRSRRRLLALLNESSGADTSKET